MRKVKLNRVAVLTMIISLSFLSCSDASQGSGKSVITVNFKYGESLSPKAYKNIYVIWIENQSSSYLQNMVVCNKLIDGGLTGTALPYWKNNKLPISSKTEVDAVTSATKANTDFSVSVELKDTTIRKFKVYFEIDRSFEPNDWFSDQPAILYVADIDLDSGITEYEMSLAGWTPNENTANIITDTPSGALQSEIRYITNLKDGTTFGSADPRSSTRMVKKISVTVK